MFRFRSQNDRHFTMADNDAVLADVRDAVQRSRQTNEFVQCTAPTTLVVNNQSDDGAGPLELFVNNNPTRFPSSSSSSSSSSLGLLTIDVVGIGDERQPPQQQASDDDENVLARALFCKQCGNELFKKQQWQSALDQYQAALDALDDVEPLDAACLFGVTEQRFGDANELYCSLRLNAAACLLQLRQFRRAHEYALCVLEDEPAHVKALYRAFRALVGMHDFAEAKCTIDILERADTAQSTLAKQCRQQLASAERAFDERERAKFSTLFS
jgi:tetratricopeptide (TPR) repeat protein